MINCKTVELLTSGTLYDSSYILAYNSNSFNGNTNFGVSETTMKELYTEPTIDTVEDIYSILSGLTDDYETVGCTLGTKGKTYVFNNQRLSSRARGHGFNTVIFLSGDDKSKTVDGFLVFLESKGNDINVATSYERSYRVDSIEITLTEGENNYIEVDGQKVRLFDSIEQRNDLTLPYLKGTDLKNNNLPGNYSKNLLNILNGFKAHDVYTDSMYFRIMGKDNYEASRIKIKREITLSDVYSDYNNFQFSYYKGDPSLFIWDDQGDYSIFSLTTSIGEKFNDPNNNFPYPYTDPRSDFKFSNEIYTLKTLEGEKQEIRYFCDHYIITEDNYLFDINSQANIFNGWVPKSLSAGSDYSYYENLDSYNEGKKAVVDSVSKEQYTVYPDPRLLPDNPSMFCIPEFTTRYLNDFLADELDPCARIQEFSALKWQTYRDCVMEFPGISNVYANPSALVENNYVPVKKIGDWIRFDGTNTFIYTSLNKSVKFRIDEPDPIVINDQVLLEIVDDTYYLYDHPGFYRSARNELYNSADSESFGEKYETTSTYSTISKPTDIASSYLRLFRRSSLPEEGFKIVGAFRGLIFYRVNNKIKYL